jgi:hypothetical protein
VRTEQHESQKADFHEIDTAVFFEIVEKILVLLKYTKNIVYIYKKICGPGSSVGVATGYGLDGPGIESR